MFNSVVNPMIYAVRKRQFRVAFVELFLRKSYQEAKDIEKRLVRSSDNTREGSHGAGIAEGRTEDEVQVNQKQEQNRTVFVSSSDCVEKKTDRSSV